jgi:hypothetical protein
MPELDVNGDNAAVSEGHFLTGGASIKPQVDLGEVLPAPILADDEVVVALQGDGQEELRSHTSFGVHKLPDFLGQLHILLPEIGEQADGE